MALGEDGGAEDFTKKFGMTRFRVLNVAPQDLTPQQQRQVLARFQMLGKDGGFGVRSLVDDGEYSQLAMISEYLRLDASQATNIDWLKEQILAGEDEAESATALLVLERTARFRESLGDALTDGVQDTFIVGCSADLPLSAGKMANGRRVTQ